MPAPKPPPPALSPAEIAVRHQAAEDWIRAGEIEYSNGKFEQAIRAFKQAYDVENSPIYLKRIGDIYYVLADCNSAAFFYKRYMALEARDAEGLDAPQRADSEEQLREVQARLSELLKCPRPRANGYKPPKVIGSRR